MILEESEKYRSPPKQVLHLTPSHLNQDFIIQKPFNSHLQSLVDYYFFIDIPVSELKLKEEHVIPFPRITFGYFFEHPFLVTNHSKEESIESDMIISRISTDKISVKPITDRVKIIGAHVRPNTLAHLTDKNISQLPWLIKTEDLFGKNAQNFKYKINTCADTKKMFAEVETIFLKAILAKNLNIITKAIDIIELEKGAVTISVLSNKIGVSSRTLLNRFYYHATYKTIDSTFLYVQIAELFLGALNLVLIGLNIGSGMQLSGRKKKKQP